MKFEIAGAPAEEPKVRLAPKPSKGAESVILLVVDQNNKPVRDGMILEVSGRGLHRSPGISPSIGLPLDGNRALKLE